ncbi:MAG: hypothetical protein EBS23_00825 [Betaproteobacteria bacterium]|nr:hypothetical protein [Betaproteobacteria bacterium]
MSFCICTTCGSRYAWAWEEAFDKFGFHDGDGLVMTETVADALRAADFTVRTEVFGFHNLVITAIERDGRSFIPDGTSLGYADPRAYLPDDIVPLLDAAFPEHAEVQP